MNPSLRHESFRSKTLSCRKISQFSGMQHEPWGHYFLLFDTYLSLLQNTYYLNWQVQIPNKTQMANYMIIYNDRRRHYIYGYIFTFYLISITHLYVILILVKCYFLNNLFSNKFSAIYRSVITTKYNNPKR